MPATPGRTRPPMLAPVAFRSVTQRSTSSGVAQREVLQPVKPTGGAPFSRTGSGSGATMSPAAYAAAVLGNGASAVPTGGGMGAGARGGTGFPSCGSGRWSGAAPDGGVLVTRVVHAGVGVEEGGSVDTEPPSSFTPHRDP